MDDYGIKPELKDTWKRSESNRRLRVEFSPINDLADLSVHLLAGWMRERFEREHTQHGGICRANRCFAGYPDPRHNFTDTDWDRVARLKLNGETK